MTAGERGIWGRCARCFLVVTAEGDLLRPSMLRCPHCQIPLLFRSGIFWGDSKALVESAFDAFDAS